MGVSQLNTNLRGYDNDLLRGQGTKTRDIKKTGVQKETE